MKVILQPLESQQIAVHGRTVVYLAGETPLSFETVHGRFEIPSGGQVDVGATFDTITITNKGNVPCNADVMIVNGTYERLSDVSIVQIQGITNAISAHIINEINAQVSGTVGVSSIAEAVAVQGITDAVNVQGIAEAVTVQGIAEAVTVQGITDAVNVQGIAEAVTVQGITDAVTVKDVTGNAFNSTDYTVTAGSYVDIPGRERSQVMLQNMGENETRCRVSDAAAVTPSGMWLIGGGSLFGESPILRTKAALRVWNTSEADAVITVNEVY